MKQNITKSLIFIVEFVFKALLLLLFNIMISKFITGTDISFIFSSLDAIIAVALFEFFYIEVLGKEFHFSIKKLLKNLIIYIIIAGVLIILILLLN